MRKLYIASFLLIQWSLQLYAQTLPGMEWEQCSPNGSFKSAAVVSDTTVLQSRHWLWM
jgi:hypothetical protein